MLPMMTTMAMPSSAAPIDDRVPDDIEDRMKTLHPFGIDLHEIGLGQVAEFLLQQRQRCARVAGTGRTTSVCGSGFSASCQAPHRNPIVRLKSCKRLIGRNQVTFSTSARCSISRRETPRLHRAVTALFQVDRKIERVVPAPLTDRAFLMTRLIAAGNASVTAITRMIIRLANGCRNRRPERADRSAGVADRSAQMTSGRR